MKIQRRLLPDPHVKRLVHDHQAHFIGQLHQLRRRGIVTGANGIAAHLLEHFELPLQGAEIQCRTQRPQIMMIAHAVDGDVLAVDEEPLVGIELRRLDAEGSFRKHPPPCRPGSRL